MSHTPDCCAVPFTWPEPPLNIVLVEPEIPQNTGNIARLCAATGSPLHLVGPLGFHITNRQLKRAGLDYWESVTMTRHADWDEFEWSVGRGPVGKYPDGVAPGPPWPKNPCIREGAVPPAPSCSSFLTGSQTWFFSTKGRIQYTAVDYQPGDNLVFGSESKGLPPDLLAEHEDHVLTLPMQVEHVRSLNLANTVAIVLYEALRQMNQRSV